MIEAVFEDLAVKQELFRELEAAVRPDAILATNTSALSVTEVAAVAEHPERVVGMHFFNPAPLMPLVEIVRAERTDEAAVDAAFAFAERIGKQPVRCLDTPGFIVNRILIPLLNDCIRVIDEAGITVEDLDKAMRYGAGWPMGPAALADLIGLDIHVHASEALHEKLAEPRMAPPPRLVRMAQAGQARPQVGRGLLLVLTERAVAAAEEHERLAFAGRLEGDHGADGDRVVAGVVLVQELAVDPRDRVVERRARSRGRGG